MRGRSFSLFANKKSLERQIDEFLDILSECNILFKAGFTYYLEASGGSDGDAFKEKLQQVDAMESRADDIRRRIETELYQQSLIPDSRTDVFALLEALDNIINRFEDNLLGLSIEKPEIPAETVADFKALGEQIALCVESTVVAARAFFRDITAVRDHTHKVALYEKEADRLSVKLKRKIFGLNLRLSHQAQLRDFVNMIDRVADEAEDVADCLTIYTIKRAI